MYPLEHTKLENINFDKIDRLSFLTKHLFSKKLITSTLDLCGSANNSVTSQQTDARNLSETLDYNNDKEEFALTEFLLRGNSVPKVLEPDNFQQLKLDK